VEKETLVQVLNAPLYRSILRDLSGSLREDYNRISNYTLSDLPVLECLLTEEVARRLEQFVPYEDSTDIVNSNRILLEECENQEQESVLREYIASQEEFAWSWLSDREDFVEAVESSDEEAVREFLVEEYDDEILRRTEEAIRSLRLFDEREDILMTLIEEFDERNHHHVFLTGISTQFEGVLSDLVEELGGEVKRKDGTSRFRLPERDESDNDMDGSEEGAEKNLNNLIDSFFDGPVGTFLHQDIRQRRNRIAHGEVVEDDRQTAIEFLLAFHALCYKSLDKYVRYHG
jgi:hypothetical protein